MNSLGGNSSEIMLEGDIGKIQCQSLTIYILAYTCTYVPKHSCVYTCVWEHTHTSNQVNLGLVHDLSWNFIPMPPLLIYTVSHCTAFCSLDSLIMNPNELIIHYVFLGVLELAVPLPWTPFFSHDQMSWNSLSFVFRNVFPCYSR